MGVDGDDAVPEAQRLQDLAHRVVERRRDVLLPPVDRGAVGPEQPPVPVLLAERVDRRGELVEPAVHLPPWRLSAIHSSTIWVIRGAGSPSSLLVRVPEQRAPGLVVAPVAQRVLTRLELARLDALGDRGDPVTQRVGVRGVRTVDIRWPGRR